MSASSPLNNVGNELYCEKNCGEKGKGLAATVNISAGTCILADTSLLTVKSPQDLDETDVESLFFALPQAQRKLYRNLYCPPQYLPDHKLLGIVVGNALPLTDNSSALAVFPTASRINHSCSPNCAVFWSTHESKLLVHALRDIKKGDEITITYLSDLGVREARQAAFSSDGRRMPCLCDFCHHPPGGNALADNKISRLRSLMKMKYRYDSDNTLQCPQEVITNTKIIIDLLAELDIPVSRFPAVYRKAGETCGNQGDLARAKCFFERAINNFRIAQGSTSQLAESSETSIRQLLEGAARPRNTKWSTQVHEIPRNASHQEFDRWLFRLPPHVSPESLSLLRDSLTYPCYESLPEEGIADMDFLHYDSSGNVVPRRHWLYLGEILEPDNDGGPFAKLRTVSISNRTSSVEETGDTSSDMISFHTQYCGQSLISSFNQYRDCTIAILYPTQQAMSTEIGPGIRIDDERNVQVNFVAVSITNSC